jgi:hypothetical protein
VTQKNICKKAVNLILNMEAPKLYFAANRAKVSDRKHQGIIVDYRSDQEVEEKKKAG